MSRQYGRARQTVFDLYTERDATPGYLRASALVASWLTLGGYAIFSLIFTSEADNLKPTRTALIVIASIFLIVGYGAILLLTFLSRSLLFCFDAILMPYLTASVMGVFVTVLNHALHKDLPIPTQAYIYVPLATACIATIAIAILSFVVFRRLSKIKGLDKQTRQHVRRSDRHSYTSYGDAASTSELLPMDNSHNMHIPEDEAQRQQLLRLLLNREIAHYRPRHQPHIRLHCPARMRHLRSQCALVREAYLLPPADGPCRAS
jgi:hypothetical protein